jgi:nucleotide-binding universal stress UspA family protein
MEGIIVGLDESSRAEAALGWARRYADVVDQPVTAVMAWGFIDQRHVDPDAPLDPHYGAAGAAGVLDELVDRACGPRADVRRVVVNDLPARALLDAATDAALLVIGARSISPVRGLVHESISRLVLRDAPCPVVVVRDCAPRERLPVVVGVDGSGPSRRALGWAIDHARTFGRPLVAVHAGHDRPDAGRFLREQVERADAAALTTPITCRVAIGPAAEALIEASATAGLVVVGSRGQGAISRAVLGSVSDRVSHHASAPVVVVP